MTAKQTPQQPKSASDVTARHHPLTSSSAAAKVTPHEPEFDSAQSSKGVRFAAVSSNRGRYTSPGRRAPPAPSTTPPEQSAVGSPAPSLCSAPSRDDEPRKPAAVKSAEVSSLFLLVKSDCEPCIFLCLLLSRTSVSLSLVSFLPCLLFHSLPLLRSQIPPKARPDYSFRLLPA